MTSALLLAALTNAVQLADALLSGRVGETFDLTAAVSSVPLATDNDFAVQDASGAVILFPPQTNGVPPRIGARIRAQGVLERKPFGHTVAACHAIAILGESEPPPLRAVAFDTILSGVCDAHTIRTTGLLRDWFLDEIDPKYLFLILTQGNRTITAVSPTHTTNDQARLDAAVGQELTLTGVCDPHPSGLRRKIGRLLRINDLRDVPSFPPQAANPFDLPRLDNLNDIQPTTLPTLGRRRVSGRVIAVWQRKAFLLQTADGTISRVDLADGSPPTFDESVEVVGFPETDLFRINFARAIWRPTAHIGTPPVAVSNISARVLLDCRGMTAFNADLHGRTVRLRGIVRSLPRHEPDDGRFFIESDGATFPVDVSALTSITPALQIGCEIELTATCVMDCENGRPNHVFPHIKEALLVARTPADIVVVKELPWWTPQKLLLVIASLVLSLGAILGWNRSLQTLARKQGKALAKEELERLAADLKFLERTRLAVELHDSVAQNLTGVSMEIDAGLRNCTTLPPDAAHHFTRAVKTLDSCRTELRNCLWDLRSQALEERDLNRAIRLTLSPILNDVDLKVRFNVSRDHFSDNTAHSLLSIIRELAANAIRHGHATALRIAGCLDRGEETKGVIRVSVRDNGCGFDPACAPGVSQGHFGLQGIRERVASLEGELTFARLAQGGMRAAVSLIAETDKDKEHD